jgi:hypothetical protein
VLRGQYELSCDKDHPALFSKAGFLRVLNIYSVYFVVRHFCKVVMFKFKVMACVCLADVRETMKHLSVESVSMKRLT